MTEIAPRLPCPVCLGTTMDRLSVGPKDSLQIDHCRRCGGFWLEHGEVQQLRRISALELWKQVERRSEPFVAVCHDCGTPTSRAASGCALCGWKGVLDCPDCARPMATRTHAGLRLDVCESCKGVWFDNHELQVIWGKGLERALERRRLSRRDALGTAADVGSEVLFNALFFAPDLVYLGGRAAAGAASATIDVARHLPEAIGAAPEVAASAVDAIGEAAASVFEVILSIVAALFD